MQKLEWRSDPPDREGWWVFCFSGAGGATACAVHFWPEHEIEAHKEHPMNSSVVAWLGPLPLPPKERL